MALIKCPECGKEISDKAIACPQCGYPINVQKSENDSNSSAQNKEIKVEEPSPVKTKSHTRALITSIVIACIIIVVLIIVLLVQPNSSHTKYEVYNDISWGTSYSDVSNELSNSGHTIYLDDDSLTATKYTSNFDGLRNVNASAFYSCKDDGTLHQIYIYLYVASSKYTVNEVYSKLVDEFTEIYGIGENKSYEVTWTTSDSEISVIALTDEAVGISYDDLSVK